MFSRHLEKRVVTILEKVATILDFHMLTYMDLKNGSKHFGANYQASAAIINYLDKYTFMTLKPKIDNNIPPYLFLSSYERT